MLDAFLNVLAEKEKVASVTDEMTEVLKQMPLEEIQKVASGALKLSYYDSDSRWLEQFEGTPLLSQAVALEQELIKLEATELEKRIAENKVRDDTYDLKDKIRLKKKMLELQLAQSNLGKKHPEAPTHETEEHPAEADVAEKAASAFRAALKKTADAAGLDPVAHRKAQVDAELARLGPTSNRHTAQYNAYLLNEVIPELTDVNLEALMAHQKARSESRAPAKGALIGGLGGAALGALGGALSGGRGDRVLPAVGGALGAGMLGALGGRAVGGAKAQSAAGKAEADVYAQRIPAIRERHPVVQENGMQFDQNAEIPEHWKSASVALQSAMREVFPKG